MIAIMNKHSNKISYITRNLFVTNFLYPIGPFGTTIKTPVPRQIQFADSKTEYRSWCSVSSCKYKFDILFSTNLITI